MKSQKHPSDQRLTPPRFILIKSMVCGLALLASGQAFAAATYSSAASPIVDGYLNNLTAWSTSGCTTITEPTTGFPMTSADAIVVCDGHTLNLTSAVVTAGFISFKAGTPAGTWGGTALKPDADIYIENYNASLPAIPLDVSSMTSGQKVSIYESIAPDSLPVKFSPVAGGSLSCNGSPYTLGDPVGAGIDCTITLSSGGGGGGGTVSAPIFSTKEKPAVFSEEVK